MSSNSDKKLLVVFGATGNQGGSVIDLVLSTPDLSSKYSLRGITRSTSSPKAQALTSKGVEMVSADLNDPSSLQSALQGAYGVYGITDFWSLMSKEKEITQGKAIFSAARSSGVKHLVFSALPYAEKLTNGQLAHVEHFDSKAIVKEYIEENKKSTGMIASYFMPAMFLQEAQKQIRPNPQNNNKPTIALPFPDENIAWPMIDVNADTGKYVMGLFEGGSKADGVSVNGVSTWTTPKEFVAAVSKSVGKEVDFVPLPREVFEGFLPDAVKKELGEMMDLIGKWNYFGKGQEKEQEGHDEWLAKGTKKVGLEEWVGKTKFEI
ncbi:NmrA-like family domain-containing protein 1 [Cercospora beticola]|uniref:NmrA-like family domain-containing protein 1 n=1 Tax=Cercospora beticola TaxID=122368 RepID=A0A2G5I6M1_CERBT|nr:NmrA-like family domain-containing protein 1 [Cercospora beticola]PIB00476.1 NmrA-like family domain-containing protein 1 [Cercospora beticola]WPA95767.1 hypothetical protein RHO25_000370 [Cercospora beticola]CAK1355981.1 unnamed protein product [Cercospora beticola]